MSSRGPQDTMMVVLSGKPLRTRAQMSLHRRLAAARLVAVSTKGSLMSSAGVPDPRLACPQALEGPMNLVTLRIGSLAPRLFPFANNRPNSNTCAGGDTPAWRTRSPVFEGPGSTLQHRFQGQ